ncbi:hypothetical protein NDU88_001390 [Pleurodeles waltl]|uniref:Uncharacterized protein n=1 Tax=Pleurodeles waltl TaxID=8319 RepID=A0AAV7USM8_PLEWA|nr:hypothetical protein NDU88_001390 [Pleurodeles waltl]
MPPCASLALLWLGPLCAGEPQTALPRGGEMGWSAAPSASGATPSATSGGPWESRAGTPRHPSPLNPGRLPGLRCPAPQAPPGFTSMGQETALPLPTGLPRPHHGSLTDGPGDRLNIPDILRAPPEPGNYACAIFGCLATPHVQDKYMCTVFFLCKIENI